MAAKSKKATKKTSKKVTAKKKTAKKAARKKTAKKAAKKAAKKTSKKKATKSTTGAGKSTGTSTAGKKTKKKAGAGSAPGTSGKKKTTSRKSRASTGSRRSSTSLQTAHSVIPGVESYQPGKGEEYMNEAQRDHFREILLVWRSQLVSDITRTISSMQDESFNHPDPTDRATQETDMSLELRSRDRERKLIKKIDETIQRIDEDDYGFCDNCGVEIGIARLEARPTATLCIDCKTLDEIRERQMV